MINISQEDYLTTIYRNINEDGEIKPTLLAEKLKISNAAERHYCFRSCSKRGGRTIRMAEPWGAGLRIRYKCAKHVCHLEPITWFTASTFPKCK